MITKFRVEHWDPNSNVKVLALESHLSGHPQIFPPDYRNIQEFSYRSPWSRAHKEYFSKNKFWFRSLWIPNILVFGIQHIGTDRFIYLLVHIYIYIFVFMMMIR